MRVLNTTEKERELIMRKLISHFGMLVGGGGATFNLKSFLVQRARALVHAAHELALHPPPPHT